jgi:PAS domain S-box-containing protein
VNEWNESIAEMTGFSPDDVFNQPFVETFITPERQASVQAVLEAAQRGRGTTHYEIALRTTFGHARRALVNITTRRNTGNQIVGVMVIALDVTEACRHENDVAAMASELRKLVDTAASVPVFGCDQDGVVNEWNEKAVENFGYRKEEAFNCKLVENFIVPYMQDSVQELVDQSLQGHGTSNYELEFVTKSSETRHLLVNGFPRRDVDDNIIGGTCTIFYSFVCNVDVLLNTHNADLFLYQRCQ